MDRLWKDAIDGIRKVILSDRETTYAANIVKIEVRMDVICLYLLDVAPFIFLFFIFFKAARS